jgi:hypothetical protein
MGEIMTDQKPNCYVITEDMLNDIELRIGAFYGSKIIRSRPVPSPQWTDEEVMKELQDAFDRGVVAAEETIDMQKHDTAIRNATLDAIIEFTKGNSETIEADDGSLEDAVFLGELLAKIESLRIKEQPQNERD